MKLLIFIRSFFATILMPPIVVFLGLGILISHFIFNSRAGENLCVRLWGVWLCYLSGVEVRVHNEHLLPNNGYLLLFNHSSFFDIFTLNTVINGLRFGAKAELFKIPLFGQAMRAAGTLPIERNNREEVIRIYDEAKKRFANGDKIALSPEGGRFYDTERLLPFKSGPFIFAISSAVPIVPVVIHGAYEVLPKGAFLFNLRAWHSVIDITILESVETKDIRIEDRHKLMSSVYDKMNQVWLSQKK